jgi:hypothetical protein
MTRYAMLAAASLACSMIGAVGCQNSGHHAHAEADVDRPRMADTTTYRRTDVTVNNDADAATAGATIRADANFTTPYTLQNDSSYRTSLSASNDAGTLHKGDTVYLRTSNLSTAGDYVQARTADGRTVYVRTADLRPR